nr:retrovirus-related Pol polyprotein from transposon TNT 1-94 [Tanacetum cinerariifolium]
MKEGAFVADHINEFNSILSRLMSIDFKFDDEVQALLLLYSLPESWSGTITTVSGSTRSTKFNFDNIRDLIIEEDISRKTSKEYSNSLLVQNTRQGHNVRQRAKAEQRRKGCCPQNSFSTSWTLKDVRYISGLKKRLISVRQLDEEGYHIGFGDQQWKITKGSLVVAHENKRGSLYMVEKVEMENETNHRVKCSKSDNGEEYSSKEFIMYCAKNRIKMLKRVLKTPQKNSVAERIDRTLNERARISDMVEIRKLKRQLSEEFEMKDLGSAKQILSMSIIRDKTNGTLRLSQEKYIGKVLEKFNMKDAEAKCQPLGDHFKLMFGTTDSWMSRIQKCVTLSTTKAEYMAIAEAGKELKILGAKNPTYMLTKVVTTEKLKLYAASTGLLDN